MTRRRFAVDTSVAVPLLLANHTFHAAVNEQCGDHELCLAGHARFETFSVLTRLPVDERPTAAQALEAINASFPTTVWPSTTIDLLAEFVRLGIVGGAVYDGLVALAAKASGLPLATIDRRALPTYAALGVETSLVDVSGATSPRTESTSAPTASAKPVQRMLRKH